MATPKSVLELAKKAGAKMVDIKFVDTFGTWQHFTMPIAELSEETFAEGIGFDGSSIRGWKSIEASDMLARPDPNTAFIDPFCAVFGSGMASMSEASMLFQPRMLEPSKPRPSAKTSSVSSRMGQLKCCQVPKVSTNLMSTILAPLLFANSITLLGVLMFC